MNIMLSDDVNSIVNNKDSDTFQKITTILCEKRRILEDTISKSTQEEKAGELLQLVEEMQTFGITEIDYQKYLASKK
jgi:hypothetical protein